MAASVIVKDNNQDKLSIYEFILQSFFAIDNTACMEYSDSDMDKYNTIVEDLITWINQRPAVSLVFAESDDQGRIRTQRRPLLELLLVLRGSVRLFVADRSAQLASGDCALVNAWFGNHGDPEKDREWLYACVSFDVTGVQSFQKIVRKPLLEIRSMENLAVIHQLYREVSRLFHAPDFHLQDVLLKASALRLLAALYGGGAGMTVQPDAGDRRLQTALAILHERQTDPALCVTDLARAAAVSPNHLGRLFRREFGMSPMPYLLQTRLNRARSLLNHTHLTVKEVAFTTGFSDPLYFSRVFHKKFGAPPTETRQSTR